MLQELIEKQRAYTSQFFESFDIKEVEKLIEFLAHTKGIVFFSGVGKSGFIAKKIAFTMASTGTRAIFLSPIDALHGDIGMASTQDSFLLFSKSGESEELIHLVAAIKNKGARTIAIVCEKNSRLSQICDTALHLNFPAELCPFDLAPTISTTYQLLLGDLMTIAIMKRKNFTLDEYALNHPAGRIGKRAILKVKDIMLTGKNIPMCEATDPLEKVIFELTEKRCGCLVVVDSLLKISGIFTDGDLRRALQEHREKVLDMPIGQLMTPHVKTATPHMLAWDALKWMEANSKQRLSALPVIDEKDCLIGLLHVHDILQHGI